MYDVEKVTKEKDEAFEKYKQARAEMEKFMDDLSLFSDFAQKANDAWLEYKRLTAEAKNCEVMKNLDELYGCR